MTAPLPQLQEKLRYRFKEPRFLALALTHASATAEENADNERLEFLGDAVVSLLVNDYLYRIFTKAEEGDLTRIKSEAVSARSLARRAKGLELAKHASFGRGLEEAKSLPPSVLANLFEAVAGAIYLDGGLEAARAFVLRELAPEIETIVERRSHYDGKSLLQDYAQRVLHALPDYRILRRKGPAHQRIFEVTVTVGKKTYGPASGRSRKEAEQGAADMAVEALALRKRPRRRPRSGPSA